VAEGLPEGDRESNPYGSTTVDAGFNDEVLKEDMTVSVRKLVLDILKPHQPNALEFSQTLAAVGPDYRVHLTVLEVDESTDTLRVVLEGQTLDFDAILAAIDKMGGSLHSIDEVEVLSEINTDR
jgi:hypothetical protein